MQLDLFAHGRDTLLRNDLIDALLRRDAAAARTARQALADEEPGDPVLAGAALLIDALHDPAKPAPASHADIAAARQHLLHALQPAARQVLGSAAAAPWLTPLWRRLAERASALPFLAAHEADHAAALWLQAGDAAAAARAAQGIPSWRRIPAPLAWMAQARQVCDGLDAAWPLLVELAWLAPARLAQVASQLADPLLDRLLRRCHQQFDAGDTRPPLAWFPAWLLTDQPALLHRLRDAEPGQDSEPERAFRLLVVLLGLERQGRHADVVEQRRRLRGLNEPLFAAYMATR